MLKTLLKQIKQYRNASVLAAVFTVLEVILELIIPMLMASVIDNGIESGNINNVYVYGLCMIMTAVLGLVCGVLAGRYAAIASAGVASNIRDGMYENIQTFAFSNIDKYSTAGLITRLTTDVTNLQNAYQMIIRMCVRAPISLISALIMALYISAKMGGIFCIAIVFLTAVIAFILWKTIPIFSRVFQKYDDLNASVQENVTAIRVVKSYVREDYEKEKFNKAASLIYKLYVKAESRLALNNPAMMTAMYGCIIAISWVGAKMIVSGSLTTGELTSLFSYVTNILDQYVNTDLGANGIAKYLENHGIHKIARQNGKNPLFDAALIRRIIQNPVYSGKISYGRRRTEKVHGTRNEYRQVKKDDYLSVDGLHEALVSEEVWEQAQVKVAAQAKKYEKVNRDKKEKIHLWRKDPAPRTGTVCGHSGECARITIDL